MREKSFHFSRDMEIGAQKSEKWNSKLDIILNEKFRLLKAGKAKLRAGFTPNQKKFRLSIRLKAGKAELRIGFTLNLNNSD
jgi:hypothetical protein